MAPHSSTLAWKIPWTEEPGRVPSMGLQRVRHVRATSLSLFTLMHWRRNYNPLQCSCLENPRDRRAWWAAVYGVTQNRTQLKRLSSSSSSFCIAKETINKMKRQPSGWEKIFANGASNKALISQIGKQLIQLNLKKNHKPTTLSKNGWKT